MKQLILTTLLLAMTAAATPAFAQFKDCQKTRLGCLGENPIVPIDQPVMIQVGLQVNIKCEAIADTGKNYVVDLHLVKKVQASENENLNYYLVPGNHGMLNFEINDGGAPDVQQYIMGEYVYHSDIQGTANGLVINSVYQRATRVGGITTTTELAFSPSVQGQPLKILSAQQVVLQNTVFNDDTKTTTNKLTFTESNCVYY